MTGKSTSSDGWSRRSFLRAGATAGTLTASAGLSGCVGIILGGGYHQQLRRRRRQQRRLLGGAPISFASQRGRIRKPDATIVVHTRSEFLDAIETPEAVVWIPGNVAIDMSGDGNNDIAANVIIASNRHLKGGTGGMIKTDTYTENILSATGGCRVTGIRLKGPRTDYFDPGDTEREIYAHAASGIQFTGETAIVDNCEVFGWTAEGLGLGTRDTATQGWVHHNELHHNQMNHLGYPMELYNGLHLIEWNYFAKYRHAITAYGYRSNGYEARCNVVGPPGGAPAAFAFDMHSLGEQDNFPDSVETAGRYVNVHHNVFELSQHNAFSISGQPTRYARFVANWCATSKGGDGPGVPAVSAPAGADVRKKQNRFGEGAVSTGRQRLKDLAARIPLSNGKPSPSSWSPPTTSQRATNTSSPPATNASSNRSEVN